MRTCTQCGKVYSNDLFFCLDDGTRLRDGTHVVDPTAPTEVNYDVETSLPTEIIRTPDTIPISTPDTTPSPAPTSIADPRIVTERRSSTLPYVAIGLLVVACLGLAGTLIVLNVDRILPTNKSSANSSVQIGNNVTIGSSGLATPMTTFTPVPSPALTRTPDRPAQALDPSGKWSGSWSTVSGTLFDFDLTLKVGTNNTLDGSIKWTMRRSARSDKSDKIGQSATEYVRGTYDAATSTVNLNGYSKDDPNGVLVMLDVYKLHVSSDGRKLTGAARNGGKWNGKVDLSR